MLNPTDTDHAFMQRAFALAVQGEYTARPNPCVGAVLVKNGECIGEGLHWQAGLAHAEIMALTQAGEKAHGATCYVTLEPCAHHGRTPPCVDALIKAGVAEVVIAMRDPNPQVSGKGIAALKAAGIKVRECNDADMPALNRGFFKRMRSKTPYVRAKIGMSIDGKIAMKSGESQWITSELSRQDAHFWRARSGAILTTYQTVARDDARLNVRAALPTFPAEVTFIPPVRVVLDQHLKLAPQAALFGQEGSIVICIGEQVKDHAQAQFIGQLAHQDVKLIKIPVKDEHLDVAAVLAWLGEQHINDVFIEAGSHFLGAMVKANLIDEWLLYIAPKILGHEGMPMAIVPQLENLNQHIPGQFTQMIRLGDDLRLQMQLNPDPLQASST